MPDVTELLERAAAEPSGGPDLDGPWSRARRVRALRGAGIVAFVVVLGVSLAVVSARHPSERVQVNTGPAPAPTPTTIAAYHDEANRFSITLAPGWQRSAGVLEPWLVSPRELLSIATVPTAPVAAPGNQAACASEIPKAAVDALGPSDAFVWIGEWQPGSGNEPQPRPDSSRGLFLSPGCHLPRGLRAELADIRDHGREFSITIVYGADANARRAEINRMLDSFTVEPPK